MKEEKERKRLVQKILKKFDFWTSGAAAPPWWLTGHLTGEDEDSSSPAAPCSSFLRFVLREKGELLSLSST